MRIVLFWYDFLGVASWNVFHLFFTSGAADRELRLDATDLPAPGFVQAFCASQQLSQAIAAERHCNANGQASTTPTTHARHMLDISAGHKCCDDVVMWCDVERWNVLVSV